jgi:hypothetical protein
MTERHTPLNGLGNPTESLPDAVARHYRECRQTYLSLAGDRLASQAISGPCATTPADFPADRADQAAHRLFRRNG